MGNLEQLRLYILTVECGSFTVVANKLNLSTTAVSKQISQLEENLKITLLQRSTRKLKVTPLGYIIYEKCKTIIDDITSLENFALSLQTEPQGTLHIFATPMLGSLLIEPILKNFMLLYPQLNIELTMKTSSPNFDMSKIDVALGIPNDFINKSHDNLVVIPFSKSHRVMCASKAYLNKYGHPHHQDDFVNHTYITFKHRASDYVLENFKFKRLLRVSDWHSILTCLTSGMGIASLSYISVAQLIKDESLEIVFPEFQQQIKSIDFIYKKTDYMDPKVIKFKEYFWQHKHLFGLEE